MINLALDLPFLYLGEKKNHNCVVNKFFYIIVNLFIKSKKIFIIIMDYGYTCIGYIFDFMLTIVFIRIVCIMAFM